MNTSTVPEDDSPSGPNGSISRPARIIGLAVTVTTCVVATAAALVHATEIFLILFLAVLFAVFLTHTSRWLSGRVNLGYRACLAGVVTLLLLMSAGGIALFGVQIDDQLSGLEKRLDKAQQKLQELTQQYAVLNMAMSSTPFLRELATADSQERRDSPDTDDSKRNAQDSSKRGTSTQSTSEQPSSAEKEALSTVARTAATALGSIFQTAFGLVVNSILIFFVGLFLATNPSDYRDGVVTLFPLNRRERTRQVLNLMGDSLWHWLVGVFGSMLVTGIGAGLLLTFLGVPMAMTIGVITALLTFIPNIGSVIALTLAMLLALPEGIVVAQSVFVGYVVLQLVESYVVTPLIQQQQVSMPPALLISCQAIMGVLFGFLGAAVASPMLAAVKVGVQQAYIRDVLGDVD